MLQSALEHYRRQQRITTAGLLAARKARKGGSVEVARVVIAYQLLAARDAADAVPLMLAEQGIESDPVGTVAAAAMAGTASDGRPLPSLFDQATSDFAFDLMVATTLQDAARGTASVAMVNDYAVDGYVRMLNPPSCSRCTVLAGRWFRWNQGFQRHPRCDCRHIPSREADSRDLRVNPSRYFDSLSPDEQDKAFTKAGAQAIRDGADISQVVNARRGMTYAGETRTTTRVIDGEAFTINVNRRTAVPVEIGGRPAFTSTEGTTKRGLASRKRTGRNMSQRVMPETIYAVAKDRDDALRLLKLNGFIF